jgi:hypothetical protein
MEILKMQMTRDIMTQIHENEQARRKLFLEGQLQVAAPFLEELKPKDH